jgi:hypothetical protein
LRLQHERHCIVVAATAVATAAVTIAAATLSNNGPAATTLSDNGPPAVAATTITIAAATFPVATATSSRGDCLHDRGSGGQLQLAQRDRMQSTRC